MGSNDACIISGAVISRWRGDRGGRACGKLTAFRMLAFGEPLFPVPVQSERPCRDSDTLIAALGAVPGKVALRSSWGNLLSRSVTWTDKDEPR